MIAASTLQLQENGDTEQRLSDPAAGVPAPPVSDLEATCVSTDDGTPHRLPGPPRHSRGMERSEEEMAASWWGGLLQSAKEKSKAALDMVRKDLTEFGTTMQSDAGHVVELTSSTLKDSLKTENTSAAKETVTKGINSFLERLSQALVVPPDDEGQIPITASSTDLYDRTKVRIQAIQLDPGTYLREPSGARETYGMWCEGFDMDAQQGAISDLLVAKAEVRALYTKLVPSQVSHVDFWRRYFYRLQQLEMEQARKEALMRRADSAGNDDVISWDDDWSGDEGVAEDSGSDWEKLPRPGHHHHSPSPSPSPSPPLSPARRPLPTPIEAARDGDSAAAATAHVAPGASEGREGGERSRQHQPKASVEVSDSCGDQLEGALSVATPPSVETPPPEVVSSEKKHGATSPALAPEVVSSEKKHGATSPALAPEVVSSEKKHVATSPALAPEAQAVSPEKQHGADEAPPATHPTDSFKDYLQLAADSEETLDAELAECLTPPDLPDPPSVSATDPEGQGEHLPADLSPPPHLDTPTSSAPGEKCPENRGEEAASARLSDDWQPSPSLAEGGEGEERAGREVLTVAVGEEGEGGCLKTTERGDLVVVGSDHGSPVSCASASKGVSDDEDWEQDLDIELTEEDMREAEDLARKLTDNINLEDDDWESWE